ncbi:MAG: T9SS type A sorting domain-containing protein, partial [Bacteroidales bacterium]|nr:T9SS type A sorting domain-containing protein [Bacteroidales bacterium]
PYEGVYCAKSGDIGDNQNSELRLEYEVQSNDSISFYIKVSSESNYDYIKFYIDGTLKGQWAGSQGWTRKSYAVSDGNHIFKWIYDKDTYVSSGNDCAWVDYISLPGGNMETSANAGQDDSICEDENYPLSGSATNYNSIEWTTSGDGAFDNSTVLNATYTPGNNDITTGSVTLTLTAYGDDGNVSDDMILTIYPLPNVTLQAFDDVCVYEPPFELTGGEPAGGNYSGTGVTNNWFYPETAGVGTHIITYTYEENGCANSAEETIYVDACTDIAENDNNRTIEIFPNPNNGNFTLNININNNSIIDLKIVNLMSEVIYQKKQIITTGSFSETINISNYTEGMYYLIIKGDDINYIEKIIIGK